VQFYSTSKSFWSVYIVFQILFVCISKSQFLTGFKGLKKKLFSRLKSEWGGPPSFSGRPLFFCVLWSAFSLTVSHKTWTLSEDSRISEEMSANTWACCKGARHSGQSKTRLPLNDVTILQPWSIKVVNHCPDLFWFTPPLVCQRTILRQPKYHLTITWWHL
jgi:hypothetical protein